jgi:ParB-like chromosome segregation protein Spo0J
MITAKQLTPHVVAEIFPQMNEGNFQELKDDIAANGQREQIVTYQGQILDGRHRYRACTELGIEPLIRGYQDDDPLGFVVSMNLHRRHLNDSQRALIAARLADQQRGGDRSKAHKGALTHAQAAAQLNVGERLVDKASALLNAEKADRVEAEIVQAVESGNMRLGRAEKIARLPREQQCQSLAQNYSDTPFRARAGKPRQQWAHRFDQVAVDAERLCLRMARLTERAEKEAELTPERRKRLADACRSAAQWFNDTAERLEGKPRGCEGMAVEEEA